MACLLSSAAPPFGFELRRRRSIFALILAGLLALVPRASASEALREKEIFPGVWVREFDSGALGAPRTFAIAVPPEVGQRNGDWPVLFLLHGRGRTHRSLVDVASLRAVFLAAPFCTVCLQGDDGWYIDSPVQPEARYETYLEEVLAEAGRARPLSRARDQRAIAGWSMGGYGAMRFALRHPQEFGLVATMIGLLDFPRPPDLPAGQNYPVPVERFGADRTRWREFNPIHDPAALRDRAVLVITAAEAFDRTMNERFHVTLRALNIPHEYLVLPGGHTFDVVQAAVPRVVEFVSRNLAFPAQAKPDDPL